VVYAKAYKDVSGIEFLERAGVAVVALAQD
jgi:hypothetical protein